VVLDGQTAAEEGAGEMSDMVERFLEFHGQATRQIGRNFCIPASLSNALRLLGVEGCTQETIRNEWYAEEGKEPEAGIDDQMQGVGLGLVGTLKRRTSFLRTIDTECFTRSGDSDPFDLTKADEALQFVKHHVETEHPVIVSTWNRLYQDERIVVDGFHMWLILGLSLADNKALIHDSGTDKIRETRVSTYATVKLLGQDRQLDMGLRGCITHSDYSCLALWNTEEPK
jgi:hypothetical protein